MQACGPAYQAALMSPERVLSFYNIFTAHMMGAGGGTGREAAFSAGARADGVPAAAPDAGAGGGTAVGGGRQRHVAGNSRV